MKILAFTLFLLLMMTEINCAQTPPPPVEPGVSQTLARWRAANYSDVRYKLNITLEKSAPLMKGDIEIRVNLTEEGAKSDLVLDWRTTQFQNDKDKPFAEVVAVNATGAQAARLPEREARTETPQFQNVSNESVTSVSVFQTLASEPLALQSNEHLIIPQKFLKTGENVIKINFASPIKTSGAAVTRYVDKEDGAEYVYSLFVPSDASTAFPVFDQPDLKARFTLVVTAPSNWHVISNAPIYELAKNSPFIIDLLDNKNSITPFAETKPISTYVFAFAAGNFERFIDGYDKPGSQITPDEYKYKNDINTADKPRIYVRKSQAEKFKKEAAEVFRLNREGIKFLESYFDYKFPFPKYDLVLIPEFPFGGMEHAGATFLREDRIIFPTEPTKNDYITRANVIFHEAAHQWFGDTVTMKWFDDLWLKEGFAEFMAYKTLEKVLPEYNAWKIFYERNKQTAYLTDVTRGTTPIYQEIPNLASAKSAYGNIVYRKAPSFLRQAEFYLGEKEFQTAVRAFLKKHEYANAEWTDLVNEFETASKKDLKDWANIWVKKRGMPIIRSMRDELSVYLNNSNGGHEANINLALVQNDSLWEEGIWKEKLKFLTINPKGEKQTKDVQLIYGRANIEEINFDEVKAKEPIFIFPNYQDYGYGIFLLDEQSRAYVLANINAEKDDFLRSMMWGSLWDSVRFYELAPEEYVDLVIKNIKIESDESTIQTLLGRVSTAMNYYITDNDDPKSEIQNLKSKIETLLLDKIANAKTQGQRITFYRAFLNLAASGNARMILKGILAGKSKVAVFQLKTKDKFDIVTRLIILGDKDAPALLANLEKNETSDDAKRYAYAARAGIGSADSKAKYFRDFMTNKEISESWIEAALSPFNSSRHAELTLQYLETALAELPNLKRTRKIFFVNGWLGAFLGGQKSAEALAIVNKFLADNPNLDKDLRLKILENADNLERAVKIREKYGK